MSMIIVKIVVFFMIMATLNIIREAFSVIKCFRTLKEYKISGWRTLALWCSISYLITMLITGI
jgi:hypothetical protein